MVHILITRGAGFIGSHPACAPLEGGHYVTVLDDRDPFDDPAITERNLEVIDQPDATSDGMVAFVTGGTPDEGVLEGAV